MGEIQWKSSCRDMDDKVKELMREHYLPHPIALYFAARGISGDALEEFLKPRLAGLSDPYRFPGIEKAVARLWEAVLNKEPIMIHGDYDTDGITASALLAWVLNQNGAVVHSFIPHRFDDGYGFTPESLVKALDTFGVVGLQQATVHVIDGDGGRMVGVELQEPLGFGRSYHRGFEERCRRSSGTRVMHQFRTHKPSTQQAGRTAAYIDNGIVIACALERLIDGEVITRRHPLVIR